ncbi:eukaryotic membrane protein family-domain-containing protein [Dichotomocladium elegans]|nr:eukaryotic membrane protein family-domain-containing protein [Dichotomocladium elegans]
MDSLNDPTQPRAASPRPFLAAHAHRTTALKSAVTAASSASHAAGKRNEEETGNGPTSLSFWDYLRDELTVSDFDTTQEVKRERITNFLGVPGAVEKLMGFGFVVCLDSFLYTFTILPLRFILALYHYIHYLYNNLRVKITGLITEISMIWLRPSQKCDLLKGFLAMITCLAMSTLEPSRIYHSIRGQAVLKLYVIFNCLEVFDKLCCSVGNDILDALFSKSTLGNSESGFGRTSYAKRQLRPITLFLLAAGYMIVHTSVLFFEMITLNVAINFYSNALLSLLISNQFVEIKQSVFKRFEKENLFQLSCSVTFLLIITFRNVIELSESSPSSILPSTFVPLFKLPATATVSAMMTPVVMVIASELIVDWLKHAFITKFNQIRPSIYGKYIDVLCKDLVVGSPGRMSGRQNGFVDQSPVVSRRIGFPALPLACLVIRMLQQLLPMMFGNGSSDSGASSGVASLVVQGIINSPFLDSAAPSRVLYVIRSGWLETAFDHAFRFISQIIVIGILVVCLLALKVFVGISLLGFAYRRYASMTARDSKETEKDKEMKEMSKDEELYKKHLRAYLNDPADNVMGQGPIKYTLENVDRFSMVKSRIP